MAKGKTRKRYTRTERSRILGDATSTKMTAKQVQKKYGISTVTYYLWRRQAGLTRSKGSAVRMASGSAGASRGAGLERLVRDEVRTRIQSALPAIVRDEVNSYLNTLLAKAPKRGPRKA